MPEEHISLPRLLVLFFRIGCIGFGGGMAVISVMERAFVRKRRLTTAEEFLNGIGLGQILGSFAVNAAFFVGYRLYGPLGGIFSVVAFLAPSLALVIALSHFYFRYHAIPALQNVVAGLGPVVIALILYAAWSLGRQVLRSRVAVGITAAALVAALLKMNALWVILIAGVIGMLISNRIPGAGTSTGIFGALAIPATLAPLGLLGSIAITFLKVGLIFFGGGFVLIPVLHHRLVTQLHWLSSREFLDGVAISTLTPGPISVLATFAGFRVAGVAGALVATAALMAPAIGLMWFMSGQYERYRDHPHAQSFLAGVNPAVAGLILSSALLLGQSAIDSWRGGFLCAASLILLGKFRWHPAFLLMIGAAAGYWGLLP
jgi:chromate transporter